MEDVQSAGVRELIGRLDDAVRLGDVERTAHTIKEALSEVCMRRLELPPRYLRPLPDRYARRLLHRDEDLGYTAVVMTWGPGQETQLHDHAGIWCVECVVQGGLNVQQFELVEDRGERCRFRKQTSVETGVGDAGCLIPPFEYHVLSNAGNPETSVTLHVYGGEMDHCNCYAAEGEGWYRRSTVRLDYDA